MKNLYFMILLFIGLQFTVGQDNHIKKIMPNQWEEFKTLDESGLHGYRVNLWRYNRLKFMLNTPFLIEGFERRPGSHTWQGEHIGKWIHATTLALNAQPGLNSVYEYDKDFPWDIKDKLDNMVSRLLATQLENGYMGTYTEKDRFMKLLDNESIGGGWDVWTHRYNLYGLLTYEKYYPNEKIITACRKMGDLLIEVFGEGKADITKYGTRQGISSMTILESIMMLYERTLDKKYLDFAEHLVSVSEQNDKLRLMGNMLAEGSVVDSGEGKAYQLMANLLGYLRLYRCTGKQQYLTTVLNGWNDIAANHILVTGGPWSRQMSYNGNKECFAHQDAFHPEKIYVEGCSDATWMQLNIHLFEFTGETKYFNEAERTLINSVYGHQDTDGYSFCYYTSPNEKLPAYGPFIHCCASSLPRGMEMYSNHLVGKIANNLSVNSLFPFSGKVADEFGGGTIEIKGDFPYSNETNIVLNLNKQKEFVLEFRIPKNTTLKSVKVNGKKIKPTKNDRGQYEIRRYWNKSDQISLGYNFELKAHIQGGELDGNWVAYTYGPMTLAEKLNSKKDFKSQGDKFNRAVKTKSIDENEPFENNQSTAEAFYLEKIGKIDSNELKFKISNTETLLVPYFKTGSTFSGPRTYFRLGKQ